MKTKIFIAAAALLLLTVITIALLPPGAEPVTGMVETSQTDVSSKIAGRISAILVAEGDVVRKGDTLLLLESKELDAKMGQGRGMVSAAQAKLRMAQNGARPEEIAAAKALFLQADEQRRLAQKTAERVQQLFQAQAASAQDYDQAEAQYRALTELANAAKARYALALSGARAEEVAGARALYEQALNTLGEIAAAYAERCVVSPVDGEVFKRLNDAGEIIPAGYPVLTLIDPAKLYITINLRESQLTRVRKNTRLLVDIPALGVTGAQCTVTFIAPMADFATWKATSQKGDLDLKTFEVRLSPTQEIPGLRPGMTARLLLPEN